MTRIAVAVRIMSARRNQGASYAPDSICSADFAVSFYGWNEVDPFMEAWRGAGFRIVGDLVVRKRYASSPA